MKKIVLRRFLVISVLIALQACHAARVEKEVVLYWPSQPDEPRIAYAGSHRGAIDYQKLSFFDSIFGAPPDKQFRKPYGVAAVKDKIYVTDTLVPGVTVLDTQSRKVTYLGQSGPDRIRLSTGIAVSYDGRVFVSDSEAGVVHVFEVDGTLKNLIGKKGMLERPAGLAVSDELQRLYVADVKLHVLKVFTLAGEHLLTIGQVGSGDGQFNAPTNVAIERKSGTIYVVDTNNFRIQAFDQNGKFLRKFGELGDLAGNFSRPKGIGVDSEGHVYVSDAAFSNIQLFEGDGQLLMAFGELGSQHGKFQLPAGLYIDSQDRIYVADQVNRRVEVFQYLSEQWKKAHPEEYKKYLLQTKAK